MPIVVAKRITKLFGPKKVLDNVSFEIEQGEIFGLLGSNGAGKSTITSILLGLEKPTSGEIELFTGEKKINLKKRIALVPQEDSFYYDFSVEKNLFFFGSIAGLKGKKLKQRVNFLLDWLYLKEFSKTQASFLSGGYQKLLNIAISLLHDPDLIFLDEPTVGLDPKMRQLFWDKIKELQKNGKTIVLTTHYMDEAQRLCSKVALLKKGKLLAVGKPYELIKEHGGLKVLLFKVIGEINEKDIEIIKEIVGHKNVTQQGDFLFIPLLEERTIGRTTAIAELLIRKGYSVLSSTTKEPDLEDVFLNMIGEKISD